MFLKLETNDRSDKMFLLTSKFHPQRIVIPCSVAIYMYKIMKKKKMYKIRLQRDFFETCSKWPKWLEVSVDIKILSPGIVLPWSVANIHLSNHKMMCIKSEVEEILFKLATNDHSDEAFSWHHNFGPNGLSAIAIEQCLNFFSSITADFNISSAVSWAIQDQ